MKLKNLSNSAVRLHTLEDVESLGTVTVSDEDYNVTHFEYYWRLRDIRVLVPFDLWEAAQSGDVKAQASLEGLRKI